MPGIQTPKNDEGGDGIFGAVQNFVDEKRKPIEVGVVVLLIVVLALIFFR